MIPRNCCCFWKVEDKLRKIFFRSLCLIRQFRLIGFPSALVCIIVGICVQAVKCLFCPKLLNIRRERYIGRRLRFSTGLNQVDNVYILFKAFFWKTKRLLVILIISDGWLRWIPSNSDLSIWWMIVMTIIIFALMVMAIISKVMVIMSDRHQGFVLLNLYCNKNAKFALGMFDDTICIMNYNF